MSKCADCETREAVDFRTFDDVGLCEICSKEWRDEEAKTPAKSVVVVLVLAALLLSGCATAPELPPLPLAAPTLRARDVQALAPVEQPPSGLPMLTWIGDAHSVYFVNWCPYFIPDVWIVVAGPLFFPTTNCEWQTEDEGLYSVGSESAP